MSWHAIARELRPITFGISRVYPKIKSSQKGDLVNFEVWGGNSTLDTVEVDLEIEFYSISTGDRVWQVEHHVSLAANQATEVSTVSEYSKSDPDDTVVSVSYGLPSGEIQRSSANWPQPLKYIDFIDRGLEMEVKGEQILLSAEKPVKGVMLDVEGNDDSDLEWTDNGFDVMPGEKVKIIAKGLRDRSVRVSWYGDTF
jgi:beta-mannosidase